MATTSPFLIPRPSSTLAKRHTSACSSADVCRFANVLLGLGIKKGDVVAIYMPMVPEAAVAMPAASGTIGI
jgi:acyl-coenzyme A synthetase/AMP-(fatty) acid ligase